jgi:hypothetical protein
MACDKETAQEQPVTVIRTVRRVLAEMIADNRLYRVYSEAEDGVAGKWFDLMDFQASEKLYVR